ncbi:hypothetical protein FACS1894207_0080 [Bacteroidia bacterium]|nr:hypothetical protein FACS1894207_0080 [Bacteroidia bacterium]
MLAIALITGSCSSDLDEGQTPAVNEGGHAITFKPWASKPLRAATTAGDITDFRLLATVDTLGGAVLIDGALVTGSGSSWTYAPLAYWPERDSVNFYAFSPAGSNGVTNALAGQTDHPAIEYSLPGHSVNTSTTLASQEDLLVTNHTNDYAHEGAAGVTLNFRHALSRILVQAKSEGAQDFVVLNVALRNIKSSGKLDLDTVPKDAVAFAYPTDNATIASNKYQTFWDTSGGSDGDLVADIPAGGVTVAGGGSFTDIIGDDDALYVIPQENVASDLTKTTLLPGGFGSDPTVSSTLYIEITYRDASQTDAEAKTYAVPVPAIVGDAYASSIAFEMERQYTFQFELFGRKPIVITQIKVSDYDKVEQEEILRLTWAGSNIYWDGTKLTFADSGDKSKEQYQGVFFKWGSLIGLSPTGTNWTTSLNTYVPDPATGAWSITGRNYGAIPTVDTNPAGTPPFSSDNSYLTDQTTDANINALRGDICVYLTKTGAAPKGKRWRMPTAAEFAATIDNEYRRIPETGGFGAIATSNADGTTAISSGLSKVASNQPYFPACGIRHSTTGALDHVGTTGVYWTSSPNTLVFSYSVWVSGVGVSLDTGNYRTCGFAVRCVVE